MKHFPAFRAGLLSLVLCLLVSFSGFGQNYALDFDGTDDYVSTNYTLNTSSDFTMEAWINLSSSMTSNDVIVGGGDYWWLGVINTGVLRWDFDGFLDGTVDLRDDSWHHVAVVSDGGNHTVYLDGQVEIVSTQLTPPSTGSLRIGSIVTPTFTWQGQLDEIRIWNVARSSSDINTFKDVALNGTEPGLVAYYPMEISSGLTDFAGSNHGTITGASQSGTGPDLSPHITAVNLPVAGDYGQTQFLDFSVVFDEAVFVTGTPQLAIVIGGGRTALYNSGSGTNTLVFRYTATGGDNGTVSVQAGSINLIGGTIMDGTANAAFLTLANIEGRTDVNVDTQPPAVPTVEILVTSNDFPEVTGTYDNISGTVSVEVSLDNSTFYTASLDGLGGWTYTFPSVSPGIYNVYARASDAAGNVSTDVTSGELIICELPIISTTINHNTYCVGADGSATATASTPGGEPSGNYSMTWYEGTGTGGAVIGFTADVVGGVGLTIANQIAGSYTVEVINNDNGCMDVSTVIINHSPELPELTGTVTNTDESFPGANDGSLDVSVAFTGGSGVYTYNWYQGTGTGSPLTTGPVANGLSTGDYTLVVTDDISGCSPGENYFAVLTAPDLTSPTVINFSTSNNLVNEVETSFSMSVQYDEVINGTYQPNISFNPDISSALSFVDDNFSSNTYTINYSVSDQDLDFGSVDISVDGARDLADNVQDSYTEVSAISIDQIIPSGYSVAINNAAVSPMEPTLTFEINSGETGATYTYTISSDFDGNLTEIPGSGVITGSPEGINNIDVSSLGDGTLNVEVVLTDEAGNDGASMSANVIKDFTAPSDYAINISNVDGPNNELNFDILSGEIGATYNYTVSSTGGGTPATGSGTISSTTESIGPVNLSGLGDGTLTVGVTLTDASLNTGSEVTANDTYDATGPTFNQLSTADILETTIDVNYNLNEQSTLYYLVVLDGGTVPSAFEVETPGFYSDEPSLVTSGSIGSTFTGTINITGLTSLTTYDLYFVAKDIEGNVSSVHNLLDVSTQSGGDVTPPSGYTINISNVDGPNNELNFDILSGEIGATYNYTVSSTGGGTPATGSGTISSTTESIGPVNLAGLGDGTLTVGVTLTDASLNPGSEVTDNAAYDATAPTFIQLVTADILETSIDVNYILNEPSTLYYLVVLDGGAVPSIAQVEDSGIYGDEPNLVTPGSIGSTTGGTVNITGLTSLTTYDLYFVAKDIEGNVSSVHNLLDVSTQSGATPPSLSGLNINNITETTAAVEVSLDIAAELSYVVTESSMPPTAAQIIFGQDENDETVFHFGSSSGEPGSNLFSIGDTPPQLEPGTGYYIYVVAEAGSGNFSEIVSEPFTTAGSQISEPGQPNALHFDGTDDHVEILQSPNNLDGFSELTLAAWIHPENTSGIRHIAGINDPTTSDIGYSLYLSNGKAVMGVTWPNGAFRQAVTSIDLTANEWTHLAGTYNAATKAISLYINGIEDVVATKTGSTAESLLGDNTVSFTIGANSNPTGNFFMGIIDEVRLWNTVLAGTDIRNYLYQDDLSAHPQVGSLVTHYTFNQGEAGAQNTAEITINDVSGNINDGALNNFALVDVTSNWISSTKLEINPTTPTGQSASLSLFDKTSNSAKILWTNSSSDRSIVTITEGAGTSVNLIDNTYYDYNYSFGVGSEVGTGVYVVFNGYRESSFLNDLAPNTQYTVGVWNVNGPPGYEKYNGSVISNTYTFTTDPAITPATPTNLVVTEGSDSQIDLSWTDNSPDETQFVVEISTDGGSNWTQETTVAADQTSVSVNTLSPNTHCLFRVYAQNANGDSGYTDEVQGSTFVPPGYALQFDNTDYLSLGTSPITGTGPFSIEAWFKTSSATSQVLFTTRYSGAYTNVYFLGLTQTGELQFATGEVIGGNILNSTSGGYNDGVWHHVTAVRDGGMVYLYIDGVLNNSKSQTLHSLNAYPLTIGRSIRDNGSNFIGQLDEIAIWSTALTENEIATYAEQEIPDSHPQYASLVRYYQFDHTSGTTALEVTGLGTSPTFNGTLEWVPSGALSLPASESGTAIIEEFESGIPGDWTTSNAFAEDNPTYGFNGDQGSVRITGGSDGNYLQTPLIDGMSEFSFYFTAMSGGFDGAQFEILTSTDGTNFTQLGTDGTFSATFEEYTYDFGSVFSGYIRVSSLIAGDQAIIIDHFAYEPAELDNTPPSGYSISNLMVDAVNTELNFEINGGELTATYEYSISSSGGGTPVIGDGTINSTTVFIGPVNLAGLAEGTLTVSVTLTDENNNTGDSVTGTVLYDNTNPIITGSESVSTVENQTAVTTYTANETVTWSLSGTDAALFTISSGGVLTFSTAPNFESPTDADADNAYMVIITATDAADNVSSKTVTVTVTDANENPVITGTAAPSVEENTTAVATYNAGAGITWTKSGPDAGLLTLSTEGVLTFTTAPDYEAPVDAGQNNVYDLTLTATSSSGSSNLDVTVTITDTNDNVPQITDPGSVFVVEHSPAGTAVVTIEATDADTGSSFTWSLGDGNQDVDEDGTMPFAIDANNGQITVNDPDDLDSESGVFFFSLQVTVGDGANGQGTTISITVTDLDEDDPIVTISPLLTNDPSPGLSGTINEALASVEVTINGVTYEAQNNLNGTWSLAGGIIEALTDGTYEVIIIAEDPAGNTGADETINELTVDLTAPVVTVNALLTSNPSPAFSGTVDDPQAEVSISIDGFTNVAVNGGEGMWTLGEGIFPDFGDGTYEVLISAEDPAGNAGTDNTTQELTIDRTPPAVSVNPVVTNVVSPELTGSIDDPDAAITVGLNEQTYAAENDNGTWTLDAGAVAALEDGTYDIVVTATDAVGNVGTDETADELIIDTTPPTVTVNPLETFGDSPEFTGTVDDTEAAVEITIEGATYPALSAGGIWSVAGGTVTSLAVGTYDLVTTATDAAGNEAVDGTTGEIIILPGAPLAEGAGDVEYFSFTANWRARTGVDSYRLDVAEDAGFTRTLPDYDNLSTTATSVPVIDVYYGTSYFYRVRAVYPSGDISDHSNIIQVTTPIDPETLADSLALLTIYDATGGENWDRNNWRSNLPLRDWQGIDMTGTRVTTVDLSANKLEGAFPAIETGLDFVTTMNLSDNALQSLPDLTRLTTLTVFDVRENRLEFGSLETNLAIEGMSYIPQDSVSTLLESLEQQGTTINLNRQISGSANSYTWFKEDLSGNVTELDGSGATLSLTINDFSDEGNYFVRVVSSIITDIELTTLPVVIKVSSLERDSTSLITMHQKMNGTSWNGAVSEWPNQPLAQWEGITIENERITGLNLAGSNVAGTVPREVLDVVGLTSIDLSDNLIITIPDFSDMPNLTALNVSSNLLEFDDLEKNIDVDGLQYANQGLIGILDSDTVRKGGSHAVVISTSGANNRYQWQFRKDVSQTKTNIEGADATTYTIGAVDYDNMGRYTVEVTNTMVPGLTLSSRAQQVWASAELKFKGIGNNNKPITEGQGYALKDLGPGIPFDSAAVVTPVGDEFIFDLVLGDYLMALEGDKEIFLPTYYENTYLWEEAQILELRDDWSDTLYMTKVPGPRPPLPDGGVVSGFVESDFPDDEEQEEGRINARRKVKKAGCSMRRFAGTGRTDEDIWELIAYVETNDNGEFEFGDLENGTYRFNIQYPGIPMDPDSFVEFEIGADGVEGNEFKLEAYVTEDGIQVVKVEELGFYRKYFKGLEVYPVPADRYLNVKYAKLLSDQVQMQLINLSGQVVLEREVERGYNKEFQLETAGLKDGYYILHFLNPEEKGTIVAYKVYIKH